MANPYHDAEGKFASRNELMAKIETAMKDGDFALYYKERKNLEEIEDEIKANGGTPEDFEVNAEANPEWAEAADAITDLWGDQKEYRNQPDTGLSAQWVRTPGDLDDPTEELSSHWAATEKLYSYMSSDSGIADAKDKSHFKSVMGDTFDFVAPKSNTTFRVRESSIEWARAEAAEEERAWRDETTSALADGSTTASEVLDKLEYDNVENLEALKGYEWDFAYQLKDYEPGKGYPETESKLEKCFYNVQKLRDKIVFNRINASRLQDLVNNRRFNSLMR